MTLTSLDLQNNPRRFPNDIIANVLNLDFVVSEFELQ